MRPITGLVGAIVEAWAELRIHRTRVLLSLIGVAVAVTAITSVVGLGAMVEQSTTEIVERTGGRPATIAVSAYNVDTGESPAPGELGQAFDTVVERYDIGHAGAMRRMPISVQFADGVAAVDAQAVDVSYGTMHRVQMSEGAWFTDRDERRLAPALVVNEAFFARLGSPDLRAHPVVDLVGDITATAVIVGVIPGTFEGLEAFMLNSAYERLVPSSVVALNPPSFEAWVPPELSDQLVMLMQRDISGSLGDSFDVQVVRQDFGAWGGEDPILPVKILVTGVAVLVLFLGALGLVNISLVTMRQRIREIGIRRSFGATPGRVFFSVMMESVVASVVAGIVGVMVAVLIVENGWVQESLVQGLIDVPPFPLEAAVLGLACATGVGALAGLLPAAVAVRVKVIDAIRF